MKVIPLDAYLPGALVSALLRGYLFTISRTPWAFRWVYAKGREPGVSTRLLDAAIKVAGPGGRSLRRCIGENPGVWVSTHPLTSILSRSAAVQDSLLSILVTDHHFHAFWCVPGADHYFVGRPEMRKALISRGVPRRAVDLTGIPIAPAFGAPGTRAQAELRMGLDPAPFRVLVLGGGLGIGPMEEVAVGLLGIMPPPQVVVVAGRNQRLRQRLAARCPAARVFGFTDGIPDLMAASDVCVTKPGGLTVAEAAAVSLPSLIVDPLPGHEEANTEILVREGSAFRVPGAPQVAEVVVELMRRPRLLRRMAHRMGRQGRPLAARDTADILEGLWSARFGSCTR
ncbi:MAG: hypothetical protein MUE60_15790 [Candidatus Eisenbacteria bacterium]|nr:hypothetical protein [Candidatus Eisenbacteria bacterium]